MKNIKNIKYKVSCQITKLKIDRDIDFETKITWKRNQNKTETKKVQHSNGQSIFNETLTLEFNLGFNVETLLYQPKNTQLLVTIEYHGKVKSGGSARYDISHNLNLSPHGTSKVEIPLLQCPDPSAFIEAVFSYQKLDEQSQSDEKSTLIESQKNLMMEKMDDDKVGYEMSKINETIQKFEELGNEIKKKGSSKVPQLKTNLEVIEGQKKTLQKQVVKLQKELIQKQQQFKQEQQKLKRQSDQLGKQLQRKNKQLIDVKVVNEQKSDYKQLYERSQKQLQELQINEIKLKKSINIKFGNWLDEVKEVANFQSDDQNNEQLQSLSRQNVELQSRVASMSYQLAQLFNASYEYGGPKLLDFLQTSIGLTEIQ